MDYWEILERKHSSIPRKEMMGYKIDTDTIEDAYMCGFKEGYKEAMKEIYSSDDSLYGNRINRRHSEPEVRYMGERRM
jgi:hypothetical protein